MKLHLLYIVSLLILSSKTFLCQNMTTRSCEDIGLTPDDELWEDSGVLPTFLQKMETYSGLNLNENFNLTLDACDGQICIVNPNGTAIWDARMEFYQSFMMSEVNETDVTSTIDGCLCYSKNLADYQSCMTVVRQNMIDKLETDLVETFRGIVEANCTLFDLNCIV
ncbi:hypothetical protein NQ317_017832 [Molorchus minor]|uniref:Uncharacterized protein n=1 Tax=Molorchus minor TaxID=1323400 RepID=A0ABQ9K202_9CUCU|nr:hypothetical protein NQ317_017832 [Molorchus minor]